MNILTRVTRNFKQRFDTNAPAWAGLFFASFLLAALYVLMEWVFFVTKPSFLDLFATLDKVIVLVVVGALAALLTMIVVGIVYALGRCMRLQNQAGQFLWLVSWLPSLILAALALMMIDNFTYTLFSFGISTSRGVVRGVYGVLFLLLWVWADWQVLGMAGALQAWLAVRDRKRWVMSLAALWMVIGLLLAVPWQVLSGGSASGDAAQSDLQPGAPHIIWITGDGLSSEKLSLYGYERDNTPHLRALAADALVAENAFANAANSTGSVVSMLTGKTALETRVLFSPDILHGEDAYQHLPGILRSHGYYTIQYGYPFYVDAYVVNMQDGFDMVNEMTLTGSPLQAGLRKYLPEGVVYFLFEAGSRLVDRLQHITFIQAMLNPNATVLSKVKAVDDEARMAAFLERLATVDQPVFIHMHLMGTHGPKFKPDQQYFSQGKKVGQQADWDMDFYDDAVLEFDANLDRILAALEQHGLLEHTLLVVGSDHGILYDQLQRIPLLIRFPNREIIGRIQGNVQNVDIAPTILDYLGLAQPDWMTGESLLGMEVDQEAVYGAKVAYLEQNNKGRFKIELQQVHPPFYQIGKVSVVACSAWFELDLVALRLSHGEVAGHTAPCPVEQWITPEQGYRLLLAYLSGNGYEISSLESLTVQDILDEPQE